MFDRVVVVKQQTNLWSTMPRLRETGVFREQNGELAKDRRDSLLLIAVAKSLGCVVLGSVNNIDSESSW